MYVLKLHDTSIIMLLTNNITNICREKTKIPEISISALHLECERREEVEKTDRTRMNFVWFTKISRDEQL